METMMSNLLWNLFLVSLQVPTLLLATGKRHAGSPRGFGSIIANSFVTFTLILESIYLQVQVHPGWNSSLSAVADSACLRISWGRSRP